MTEIYMEPSEVWDYFQKNKDDLDGGLVTLAELPDCGVEIDLTVDTGLATIIVLADGEEIYDEAVVSASDCLSTVRKVYDDYLSEQKVIQAIAAKDDVVDDDEISQMQEIDFREEELNAAMEDFLYVVFNGYNGKAITCSNAMIEDCKDHFLEYVARKWGVNIFRPMFLEDEDGEDFYEEYPYEVMEFDDPDNPLYMK